MSDLICRDLCMTFHDESSGTKVEALKNINFQLKQGEILTVLGPSGCGKTTLLNMIAGFLVPSDGELTLGGVDIEGPGAERGMVFQQGAVRMADRRAQCRFRPSHARRGWRQIDRQGQ